MGKELRREKDVVDVIAGPAFRAVTPIKGRHRLAALRLTSQFVIGAAQPEFCQRCNDLAVIAAPARSMPEHVVVEVAGDDAGALGEKGFVLGQCASERTQLVFAPYACACVLGPNGKQIALDRSADMDRCDVAKARIEGMRQLRPIAVAGEDGEPLVAIVANPNR